MMKKYILISLFIFLGSLIFAAGLDPEKYKNPVRYDKNSGETPQEFFERKYSDLWAALPEYEQFAIALSSNNFERNKDFHLDLCTRVNFDNDSDVGRRILTKDGITNYEQLMKEFNEIPDELSGYEEFRKESEKNPELSVIKFCAQKDFNIVTASGMYYINAKKNFLGKHCMDAWIAARRIGTLRWGMGAGFISEEEAVELIKPIVQKVKEDYVSFEDFNNHWIAAYCYKFIDKDDDVNTTIARLDDVTKDARAYIPFETLKFTGENADTTYPLVVGALYYFPDETAEKLKAAKKLQDLYNDDKADTGTLEQLIKLEEGDKDFSDFVCNLHLALMQRLSTYQERIDYLESKWDYISSLENKAGTYSFAVDRYISDLTSAYEPQKLVDFYKTLPADFQTNQDIYFSYGYANYLLAILSPTILERDVYVARARNVFLQLNNKGYDLGEFFYSWLNTLESL